MDWTAWMGLGAAVAAVVAALARRPELISELFRQWARVVLSRELSRFLREALSRADEFAFEHDDDSGNRIRLRVVSGNGSREETDPSEVRTVWP